jgi:tRNA threonylcarbamoyladenosine biosynthesis protein TsaE
MKERVVCSSEEELSFIADRILKKYPVQRIFALNGPMGVGKTTFMIYLCRYLKSKNIATSPSFSIVNEYELANGERLYHFDFYRIKNLQEAIAIGLDEYLYSGQYCFIEWAEMIEALLPPETINIKIEKETEKEDAKRIFTF